MSVHSRSLFHRRGATAIFVALILPALLLILGFSVDLAYMQLTRAELRSATDLAAKAAAAELADTGSMARAIAKGKQTASINLVAGQGLTLEDADFVFGNTTRSTTGKWVFTANSAPTNAVQVIARRTSDSVDGPIALFFSGLLDGAGFQTTFSATASFVNADICLVLDRSSSMKLAVSDTATALVVGDARECDTPWADSRWIALEEATSLFTTLMGTTASNEQVAVVTFASDHTACSETTQAATLDQGLTADLSNITSAMAALSSEVWNGNTEISVGMSLARAVLTGSDARPTAEKIMVVLTDGAYSNGIHPSGQATLAAADGIRVHTITFGAVPAAVIDAMRATAAAGGGNHYHAPDAATLNNVFTEIAGSISILTE